MTNVINANENTVINANENITNLAATALWRLFCTRHIVQNISYNVELWFVDIPPRKYDIRVFDGFILYGYRLVKTRLGWPYFQIPLFKFWVRVPWHVTKQLFSLYYAAKSFKAILEFVQKAVCGISLLTYVVGSQIQEKFDWRLDHASEAHGEGKCTDHGGACASHGNPNLHNDLVDFVSVSCKQKQDHNRNRVELVAVWKSYWYHV